MDNKISELKNFFIKLRGVYILYMVYIILIMKKLETYSRLALVSFMAICGCLMGASDTLAAQTPESAVLPIKVKEKNYLNELWKSNKAPWKIW